MLQPPYLSLVREVTPCLLQKDTQVSERSSSLPTVLSAQGTRSFGEALLRVVCGVSPLWFLSYFWWLSYFFGQNLQQQIR